MDLWYADCGGKTVQNYSSDLLDERIGTAPSCLHIVSPSSPQYLNTSRGFDLWYMPEPKDAPEIEGQTTKSNTSVMPDEIHSQTSDDLYGRLLEAIECEQYGTLQTILSVYDIASHCSKQYAVPLLFNALSMRTELTRRLCIEALVQKGLDISAECIPYGNSSRKTVLTYTRALPGSEKISSAYSHIRTLVKKALRIHRPFSSEYELDRLLGAYEKTSLRIISNNALSQAYRQACTCLLNPSTSHAKRGVLFSVISQFKQVFTHIAECVDTEFYIHETYRTSGIQRVSVRLPRNHKKIKDSGNKALVLKRE